MNGRYRILIMMLTTLLLTSLGAMAFIVSGQIRNTSIEQKSWQAAYKELQVGPVILTGDTGFGDVNQARVANAIGSYCRSSQLGCAAMFLVGDIIYPAGVASIDDTQFGTKFATYYEPLAIRTFIAFGNHDYQGCTVCYLDYVKRSPIWNMPAEYYQTNINEVEYFVINTEDFDQIQADWLNLALQGSTAKWKIVLGHRPLITYEEAHHGENWAGKDLLQEVICNKADVYVSGHAHILEDNGNVSNCSVRQVVSGAGGAKLRKSIDKNKSLFTYENFGFVSLDNLNNTLRFVYRDQQGNELYQFSLSK